MSSKPFAVIKFQFDNTVDFVPTGWLSVDNEGTNVRFPRTLNVAAQQLKKDKNSFPKISWPIWKVEVIKHCGK